jgi:predicted amidohydrolase
MPPTLKIAVIQMHPLPLSPSTNFTTARSYIRSAALQGAQLAVLPEYHLSGWAPEDPAFASTARDSPTYLQKYRDLAKELNICIVPGTLLEFASSAADPGEHPDSPAPEKETQNQSSKQKLQNTAYFINADGSLAGTYTKKNLWVGPERTHLTSSGRTPHPVFTTSLGDNVKVGLLICWDLAFPEAFRELVAQGAQLVLAPTYWKLTDCTKAGLARNPGSEALFLDALLTARAFENGVGMSDISFPFFFFFFFFSFLLVVVKECLFSLIDDR